jgi:hypothetical protein
LRPSDPEFKPSFLKAKAGLPLLRSAAGFGTAENAKKVREREGKRLNEWNKSKALRDRKERALRVGGEDLKGEQLDRLTTSIRGSVKDQAKHSFDDRPRLGIWKGAATSSWERTGMPGTDVLKGQGWVFQQLQLGTDDFGIPL